MFDFFSNFPCLKGSVQAVRIVILEAETWYWYFWQVIAPRCRRSEVATKDCIAIYKSRSVACTCMFICELRILGEPQRPCKVSWFLCFRLLEVHHPPHHISQYLTEMGETSVVNMSRKCFKNIVLSRKNMRNGQLSMRRYHLCRRIPSNSV